MKKTTLILFLFFISLVGFTQRELKGIGDWQYHIPFSKGVAITTSDSEVFSASKLGFFSYSKNTGEITIYSKATGLSDADIVDIKYHKTLNLLFIAYTNGNIDILQNNTITNFNEIVRKQIVGEKRINRVDFYNDLAFISTTFGLVVFDLIKLEVKETYSSLGSSGETLEVLASCVSNDSLFLATEKGVLTANFSESTNLLDFNNWINIYPSSSVKSIVKQDQSIWVQIADTILNRKNNNTWNQITTFDKTEKLISSNNNLYFITSNEIFEQKSNGEISTLEPINSGTINIINEGDTYWIININTGLHKLENQNNQKLTPNSLLNSSIFSINYAEKTKTMFVTHGGYNNLTVKLFRPFVIDQLGYNEWFTLGYWNSPVLQEVSDITMVVNNTEKTFYPAHSGGLIVKSGENYTLYNADNSPLSGPQASNSSIRVPYVALDSEDNLWICNHAVIQGKESIHKLSPEGEWVSFKFPKIQPYVYPRKIFIDKDDIKWIILGSNSAGNGVMVFDDENDEVRHLTTGFQNGDLQDNRVNDLAFAKDGSVWMVGRSGVSVIQNPKTIFEEGENNDAYKPIFEGRPLMENEFCTSIAIDGGNRKWIGTENGLFLMNENGNELIESFNAKNSPLPTNKINDLEIHPETGELFIGTDLGLITYRTNATIGNSNCKGQIKVFPNPANPDFIGEVGITVLTDDAEIKITDTWGNLVYQTQANGGSASWDLRDYNNNKVESGVYTILVNGSNRKRSCAENLAIIK